MRSKYTILSMALLASAFYTQQVQAQAITRFAGSGYGATTGTGGYSGDGGKADTSRLYHPTALATFGFSNVYIADQANHVVRVVDYLGYITTIAGNGSDGNSGDGGSARSARLGKPSGIAIDAAENIYVADADYNVVRKINTSGTITTVAGTGAAGYSGDGGDARMAKLNSPYGLDVDGAGNLYIADAGNNVVRKVDVTGGITTVAGNGYGAGMGVGNGAYSGDGAAASAARLNFPEGVAVDAMGNIYIADAVNNVIRKVSRDTIRTIAGTGISGYSGDGGMANAARMDFPAGIAVDGPGNLYIADQGNNVVRKVSTAGTIATLAGNGTAGYTGEGGAANMAQLSSPAGVAVDGSGIVYIADYANNVVRRVGGTVGLNDVAGNNNVGLHIYPNPTKGSITIDIATAGTISVYDMAGRLVAGEELSAAGGRMGLSLAPGVYMVKAVTAGNTTTAQVVVR